MYFVLAYYYIGNIENPTLEVEKHKEFFKNKDFKGRIYISEQGINGQSSGLQEHAEEYMQWLKSDPRFTNIDFKIHYSEKHEFPKMTVKYKKQLVAIDCDVDFGKIGEHVNPENWKQMLENRDENTMLIDVRNDYEWKVGHFEGAELPKLETFREFVDYAKQLGKDKDPKKTSVMMYCTGGIRCEFYSAVLMKEGFEKVYQLNGGVIGYGQHVGSDHWKGKLFVFDDRLVVPIADGPVDVISTCSLCNTKCDTYYNCANMDCNALFVCCLSCLRASQGCCCTSCKEEGRVRPYKEDAIPFRKFSQEQKQQMTHA